MKRQDKQLPDPTRPLFFIIPAEAIRDVNDAHTICLLPLTELTNLDGARGGESKQSRDSYIKLIKK